MTTNIKAMCPICGKDTPIEELQTKNTTLYDLVKEYLIDTDTKCACLECEVKINRAMIILKEGR